MAMCIDDLPTEVLECVFTRLDGLSLVRIESVSKHWCSLSRSLQNRKLFWKKQCCKEIPRNVLEQLIGLKSFKMGCYDDGIKWKTVYKSWSISYKISSWSSSKKFILSFCNNPITCIKLSGYWVLTSHRGGNVFSWNQATGVDFCLTRHSQRVTDIAFIDVHRSGPYGLTGSTWDHHHVISIGKDSRVIITPLLKYGILSSDYSFRNHSGSLESVRVFDNRFVVSCADNTFSIYEMSMKERGKNPLSVSYLASVIGPSEILRWISFWGSEIQCLTPKGTLCTYCPVDGSWANPETPSSIVLHPVEKMCGIKKAYIFRNSIFVLLAGDGCMILTIDKTSFSPYIPMISLHTTIISVALWGRIFALGTENGRLLVYTFQCDEDLKHLNLAFPTWSKTISEASVISIDIAVSGELIAITACTTEKIFIVSWRSPVVSLR